jgi:hypothetical protein
VEISCGVAKLPKIVCPLLLGLWGFVSQMCDAHIALYELFKRYGQVVAKLGNPTLFKFKT